MKPLIATHTRAPRFPPPRKMIPPPWQLARIPPPASILPERLPETAPRPSLEFPSPLPPDHFLRNCRQR